MNSHRHCLMCGQQNPFSLGLQFSPDAEGGVVATFRGNPFLQGYDGILHGGIISGLLDAAMVHCLFQQGISAVTGELNVRFWAPVPYDSTLTLHARVVSATPPLYQLSAKLTHAGKLMAAAESKFMRTQGGAQP